MPSRSPILRQTGDLSDLARGRLAAVSREVCFRPRQPLFPQEEPLQGILWMGAGMAVKTGVAESGKERVLQIYREGDIIGLQKLFNGHAPDTFQVMALSHVRAFAISKQDFLAASRACPEIRFLVMCAAHHQLDQLSDSMLVMTSSTALSRLARLLLDLAPPKADGSWTELTCLPTHEILAEIIGASRPHTTMLLAELEQRGSIKRLKPRGIRILADLLHQVVADEETRVA